MPSLLTHKCNELNFSTDSDIDQYKEIMHRNNLGKIKGCFAALIKEVSQKLSVLIVDMKEFRLYIATLFPPGDFISSEETVMDVFSAITHNRLWDYNNYCPVEEICKQYGGMDKRLLSLVNDYISELAGFRAANKLIKYVEDCNEDDIADPDDSIGQYKARYDKKYYRKLSVKLNVRVTEASLDYIDKFWRSLACQLNLPSLRILLERICSGSTEIILLVSTQAAFIIEPMLRSASLVSFLRQHSVITVKLDERILYGASQEKVCDLHVAYYTET